MELSYKYDLISAAYRSRLLFRTDAEYRDALRVSFETVTAKRTVERDVDIYYDILDRETRYAVDQSLEDVMGDYLAASRLYLSLDWGSRTQMASRKKFCRMIFRLSATAGRPLSGDEMFRFKVRDDDRRLIDAFFPDGTEAPPAVDVGLIALFAFGVIRPFTDRSRGRDISDVETLQSLRRLRTLIGLIRDDMPRLGATEKPLVIDEWMGNLDTYLADHDRLTDCPPLWLASSLMDITRACRALVVSEQQRIESEKLQGIYMHGIWIDDADGGRTRFWIFPDNMLAAFCYERDGMAWQMLPYELRVRPAISPSYMDSFVLLAPQGNLRYTLSSDRIIESGQMATGSCEVEADETTGEVRRLKLYDGPCPFPEWFGWREWRRLSPDDALYVTLHRALLDIYDPSSPHSALFRNPFAELTDCSNNLIARDGKYLYVYDWRPRRYAIRESDPDRYTYEFDADAGNPVPEALIELNISEEHPLYAIPMRIDVRRYRNAELDRLAAILTDADNIGEICMIRSERIRYPRLAFNAYGVAVTLSPEIIAAAGILKFTKRPL
ncbi:MAG: hypothetical protein K2K79_06480 [Paramuribaculum sp.]|nr:hypothetical protein [Paramuribaculum sp.]